MSLQRPEDKDAREERSGFFIETDSLYDWHENAHEEHHKLILQKADSYASENRLKEAIDCFSMLVRYGSVRPEQLSTLVDCVLRNFKKKIGVSDAPSERRQDGSDSIEEMLDCPSCHGFLGEPVTISCGHSYCRSCLQHKLLSECKLCNETVRHWEPKVNVILCGLFEKLFPNELKTSKAISDIEDLCGRNLYEEAVSLATKVMESEAGTVPGILLARAEAYTALREYSLALEDVKECLDYRPSAEGFYRKAVVLLEMGQMDEALQVFLHCLALHEDFPCAKQQVQMILYGLLSPAGESVKEGLRETAQSTSPHLRSKTLVADAQTHSQPKAQGPGQQPHAARAASAHHFLYSAEKAERAESLERAGLNRANSLRAHGSGSGEEGLKRVCSAPQLGDQEKGSLLKRKLSASDSGPHVICSGSNKHKKQGMIVASKQPAPRLIAPELIDVNDFECSLCMRLFYEPVTTLCGHTFCKNCLERCLDHTAQCPLCKESLKEYLGSRKYTVSSILDMVIKQHLKKEHAERAKIHQEETQEFSDLTKNVPIFVCTMAYPTVPCPLHVFEPRYRLMIRRCMDTGTRQFGMCINDPQKGFVDYGCMLIIRSVHFLPDGRSVVDTVGGKRFRVLSRGMRDGYSIADIEYLEDTRVEEDEEVSSLQELHDAVYEQACTWFRNLKVRFHNQILQHFGPMPERETDIQATPDGPACCWWLLAVLPIDPRYQLSVLSMTSLRERLIKIQHILIYLQSVPSD